MLLKDLYGVPFKSRRFEWLLFIARKGAGTRRSLCQTGHGISDQKCLLLIGWQYYILLKIMPNMAIK